MLFIHFSKRMEYLQEEFLLDEIASYSTSYIGRPREAIVSGSSDRQQRLFWPKWLIISLLCWFGYSKSISVKDKTSWSDSAIISSSAVLTFLAQCWHFRSRSDTFTFSMIHGIIVGAAVLLLEAFSGHLWGCSKPWAGNRFNYGQW